MCDCECRSTIHVSGFDIYFIAVEGWIQFGFKNQSQSKNFGSISRRDVIKKISCLIEMYFLLLSQLYKKIDDHEISWALGCAYNLLSDVSRSKK